jgi:UDP-4-amino-4,6-dideoxy-N-acetyl-beta-L-altrosamine N-acetyltransferase
MLRDATDADLPMIRRWRNHPEVRKASLTTHEIGEAEHRRWWEAVQRDDGRRVLIYEHDGTACGVVAFSDHEAANASAMWGFYVDLEGLRRSGALLAAWSGIEREAIAYARDTLGVRVLRGEVLAWNQTVRWLHRRSGFVETGSYLREVDGVPAQVVGIELVTSP